MIATRIQHKTCGVLTEDNTLSVLYHVRTWSNILFFTSYHLLLVLVIFFPLWIFLSGPFIHLLVEYSLLSTASLNFVSCKCSILQTFFPHHMTPNFSVLFLIVTRNFFVVPINLKTSLFLTCSIPGILNICRLNYISVTCNIFSICDEIVKTSVPSRSIFLKYQSSILFFVSIINFLSFSTLINISNGCFFSISIRLQMPVPILFR